MAFRNVGGKLTTPRTLVESGLVQYLEKIVATDSDLSAIFGYDAERCEWGRRNGWPIQFENFPAQTALVFAKRELRPWFETNVADNTGAQIALGRFGLSRTYHIGMVDVMVKKDSGVARQRLILEAISDFYKDLNPETGREQGVDLGLADEEWAAIRIRQPFMQNVENDDETWHRARLLFEIENSRKFTDM